MFLPFSKRIGTATVTNKFPETGKSLENGNQMKYQQVAGAGFGGPLLILYDMIRYDMILY